MFYKLYCLLFNLFFILCIILGLFVVKSLIYICGISDIILIVIEVVIYLIS